jgi:uncharacterized membrane protein YtjA (UPF0391 family)
MYGWAAFFAIIALVAAILGFGGVAEAFANIALVIFIVAIALTALFLYLGWKAARQIT